MKHEDLLNYKENSMNTYKALVTGGSRGIGHSIAEQLKKNDIIVHAPSHQELDLMSQASINTYVSSHQNEHYDIIINNAGINDIHDIEHITDNEIAHAMQINLIAPIMLLRAFVPGMKERQYGKIVNIGSIWSIVSKRGRTVYSATKHGIHGITKTLAVELAEYNICVNTVCPGFTLTELTRKNNSPEQILQISQEIPMKRMAVPDEIAHVVSFLVSPQNSYLTGQLIAVDGGYTSK